MYRDLHGHARLEEKEDIGFIATKIEFNSYDMYHLVPCLYIFSKYRCPEDTSVGTERGGASPDYRRRDSIDRI